MKTYVDTSVLVAALTREEATEHAQLALAKANPDELCISAWVVTEFSSALSIKLRGGQIDLPTRNRVLAGFARLVANFFDILQVELAAFMTAARFTDRHELNLRAGDALHIAVAMQHGATILSFDRRLVEAGTALGAATRLM